MSTIRNPVGPQPANVYWKRRAFVLLGLIAIIVIIVLIVVGGNRGETPQPNPSTSSSAKADDTADVTRAEPRGDDLLLAIVGGKEVEDRLLVDLHLRLQGSLRHAGRRVSGGTPR